MLDLRWIRQNPDLARARLQVRGAASVTDAAVGRALELDEERRQLIAEGDALKARRNTASQEVAQRKRRGEPADELIAETRSAGVRIRAIDGRLRDLEAEGYDKYLAAA